MDRLTGFYRVSVPCIACTMQAHQGLQIEQNENKSGCEHAESKNLAKTIWGMLDQTLLLSPPVLMLEEEDVEGIYWTQKGLPNALYALSEL